MSETGSGTAPRKQAFAPLVTPATRVLILGSLPGDASLAAGQYYAHPRNLFWRLAGAVIDRPDLPALPYPERVAGLLASGIGLWDTVASATRRGSLDSAICSAVAAPLQSVAVPLQNLRCIAFNGAAAASLGRRQLGQTALELVDLPSSSPANAAIPYAVKHERWLALQQFLC